MRAGSGLSDGHSYRVGGVARNLVLVGRATAIGQGTIVMAAPMLARLSDPQAFGLLSVYAAALSVLVAIASLRFDFAIPIAPDPVEAAYLLTLSVVISLVPSIVLALVPYYGSGPEVATGARAAEAGPRSKPGARMSRCCEPVTVRARPRPQDRWRKRDHDPPEDGRPPTSHP